MFTKEVHNLYKQSSKKFWVNQTISFLDEDYARISTPYDDALVITAFIENYAVNKKLVDNRSLVDILYHYNTLHKMDLQGMHMESGKEALL